MGKNSGRNSKGKNKDKVKSASSNSAEAGKTIDVGEVKASTSQSEFDEKKERLIEQLERKVAELQAKIDGYDKEINELQKNIEHLKEERSQLEAKRGDLQKENDNLRDDLEKTSEKIDNATKEAEEIRLEADKYADEKRKKTEDECLSMQKSAADEARKAYQIEAEAIKADLKEIAEREISVDKATRKLEEEREFIEDEKEAIEEKKLYLEERKKRYESSSPEKISALELELSDEKSRYGTLMKRYKDIAERYEELQVIMDTIRTEIKGSDGNTQTVSVNELVYELQSNREKYNELAAIHERYPSSKAISELEEKAKRTETLEKENEALKIDRNRYQNEVIAAKNTTRELEVIKQEVDATNALNEHLLKELESHKTALESRTGDTCPSLAKIDGEVSSDEFIADVKKRMSQPEIESLVELVSHVKNYAGSRPDGEKLFYKDNDIRAFLAGMAVSRLIILQGMSGTGKSSLPRIFAQAISGFNRLIPVESSWRDRNELLGYYNDFNKKFNAKSFTLELYKSSKVQCQDIPAFIVLDEMNLARIEYYFSDFLAVLQEPDPEKWLIELVSSDMRTLPMELPDDIKARMASEEPGIFEIWRKIERSRQGDLHAEASDDDKELLTNYLEKMGQLTGAKDLIDGRKIRVTENIWFIGTANRDESTFEISDKVYDRAQVVSLNEKREPEGYDKTREKFISVRKLEDLFYDAEKNSDLQAEVKERLDQLDKLLVDKFDVSFGNRIVVQTIKFVTVFVAAGGRIEDAMDYQISTKILRKVITSDDEEALTNLYYASEDYPETARLIEKRIKELQ